jgi:hypothetical protein
MPNYIVNNRTQSTGEHEVHITDCKYFPKIKYYTDLGWHNSCGPAKVAAKKVYANSDGCATCCPDCHTR